MGRIRGKVEAFVLPALVLIIAAGCHSAAIPDATDAGPDATVAGDPAEGPINGISKADLAIFYAGDDLFSLPYREPDGLGPLYVRLSCGSCHAGALRGPGLIQKMAVVAADNITPAPDDDQTTKLPFGHSIRPLLAGGGKTPLLPPAGDPTVRVTTRIGPPVIGHGYMEAVLDSEIERVQASQALLPRYHGRINHVKFTSVANPDTRFHTHQQNDVVIGRFGMKAKVATLDDFVAEALQLDIGMTSPMRPNELPNPDGLTDDLKPGIDVPIENLNTLATYLRFLAIPKRDGLTLRGEALFAEVGCATCHVPTMKTRPDYPIALLAGIDAPVFTDFLLHDMGEELADGVVEYEAGSRDWRTEPLIGLRFVRSYMHDGRAMSLTDAILLHGGTGSEAKDCVDSFHMLTPADQLTLVNYVGAL